MPSLRSVIESARHSLSGYGAYRDTVASLQDEISPGDLIIRVDSGQGLTAGLVEIGTEMMLVRQVDPQNSALLLPAFGRGYNDTVAVAHHIGDEVTLNPTWPRSTLARLTNELIEETYPQVYGVASTILAATASGRYTLPSDAVGVISVWSEDAHSHTWDRIEQWSFDRNSDPLNPGLRIAVGPTSVRVVYSVRPRPFDLELGLDQDFATTTGLEQRHVGLIALGIAAKMAPFFDVARLPSASAEARADASVKPYNGGVGTARTLLALYQQRLAAESAILRAENPIRLHLGVS